MRLYNNNLVEFGFVFNGSHSSLIRLSGRVTSDTPLRNKCLSFGSWDILYKPSNKINKLSIPLEVLRQNSVIFSTRDRASVSEKKNGGDNILR